MLALVDFKTFTLSKTVVKLMVSPEIRTRLRVSSGTLPILPWVNPLVHAGFEWYLPTRRHFATSNFTLRDGRREVVKRGGGGVPKTLETLTIVVARIIKPYEIC